MMPQTEIEVRYQNEIPTLREWREPEPWRVGLSIIMWAFVGASIALVLARSTSPRLCVVENQKGVFVVNREGDIVEWGSGMRDTTGWQSSEAIGKNVFSLMTTDKCRKDFLNTTEYNATFYPRTCALRAKDGGRAEVRLRFAKLDDSRYVGIITE